MMTSPPRVRSRTIWALAQTLGVVELGLLLHEPARVHWILLVVAAVASGASSLALRGEGRLRFRGVRLVGAAVLLVAAGLGWQVVRTAERDDAGWEQVRDEHMQRAAETAIERLERIRELAAARARRVLDEGPKPEHVEPIRLADAVLEVAVSVWRADSLVTWLGPVPGPERVGPTVDPLLVDYGYRRYLIVQAEGDEGLRASCDVALGVSEDLFPRLGLSLAPGDRLAPEFSATIRLWPQEPEFADLPTDAIVSGVPPDAPWAWIELVPPRLAELRRRAFEGEGQRLAVLALIASIPLVVLAWGAWPGRAVSARGTVIAVGALLVALAIRVLFERAGILELAFAPEQSAFSLLFLPTYFASSVGGGLLRSTADFLLTGVLVAAGAIVLLPAWRVAIARARAPWARVVTWVVLTGGVLAQIRWTEGLQELVVKNANPLLIGLDSPFFTLPFLALHVAMMLVLLPTALVLMLGWERWFGLESGRRLGLAIATLAILIPGLVLDRSLALGAWGLLLPALGLFSGRVLASPAFSRRVLAGLLVLIWFAGVQSTGLERVYNGEKEQVALQEAEQRLEPLDNWRRFLLEDLMQEIAADRLLLRQLGDRRSDRSNLAFELWARTLLPSQNFGCRVELRSDDGSLVSEFDIGLPYEPTPLRAWRRDAPMRRRPVQVEAIEIVTEQGPFLVYRGRADLEYLLPEGDASRLTIDLPYAAAEGSIPLEQNVPVGMRLLGHRPAQDLPPRQTFDAAVLVGHPVDGRVRKSSSAALIGLRVDDLPPPGLWTRIRVDGRSLHVARIAGDGKQLVVAFEEPSAVDRLLDLSRLAALYLIAAALGLALYAGARLLRVHTEDRWPRALGVMGFEERLLGSMLLIVLLPVLILGVIQERRGASSSLDENLDEVSERLDTALQLIATSLDELASALIRGEYVQEFLETGEARAPRTLGPFAAAQLVIYDPVRTLLLDETLGDRSPAAAEEFLRQVEGGELLLEVDDFGWFVGRAYPVLGPGERTYTVYVRRSLTDEDLSRIARTVRADLTIYDGPWAVVSSQAYMYKAGLRSPILSASAIPVLRGGSRRVVEAERFGGLAVAQGYGVMQGPDQPQRGVLSARLFARATEDARELRRVQMFVFGLSSLALVLAVVAGLALSGRIVGPIRALVSATDRIARGELDLRVREGGRDEIGQLERSFNRMTDALNQSRRQLASRRSFLETVLGSLGAGVLVLDQEVRVVEGNEAASRLLDEDRDGFVERIRDLGPPAAPTDTEIVLAHAEGPRTLRTVVSPARLESGSPGWLVVFDDVTELLASRRLALYAQMARQVAHEIKNPLTPIQLSAQLVRQAASDAHPRLAEIASENTVTIEAQVERLRTIASEFSLLGRDTLDDLQPVDVVPLLEEVAGLYPSLDHDPAVEVDADASPRVLASPDALHKVVVNLVENARHAMDGRGTVRIEVSVEGPRVRIRVLDEGIGIDPDVQSRLFEPYFSTKSTGTGLGLVICRSLMEKMGGSIALRNRRDRTGAVAELSLSLNPENDLPGPSGNDSPAST